MFAHGSDLSVGVYIYIQYVDFACGSACVGKINTVH